MLWFLVTYVTLFYTFMLLGVINVAFSWIKESSWFGMCR